MEVSARSGRFKRIEKLYIGGVRTWGRRELRMLSRTEEVMFERGEQNTSNNQPCPQLPQNFHEHNGP